MTREELLSRISIAPAVCFGKPCIRGHRIWVSLVLDYLASGCVVGSARPRSSPRFATPAGAAGGRSIRERFFLRRQSSLEQKGFKLAEVRLRVAAETLTQGARVAACFQSGT